MEDQHLHRIGLKCKFYNRIIKISEILFHFNSGKELRPLKLNQYRQISGRVLLVMAVFCINGGIMIPARGASAENTSVDWLCKEHPEVVTRLFDNLQLDSKVMEPIKVAVDSRDWPAACNLLIQYYERGNSGSWLRREPLEPTTKTDPVGEKMLNNTFTIYNIEAKIARLKTGGLDWVDFGPENDIQWALYLNRHHWMKMLLDAYFDTGNETYIRRLDEHFRDWVLSNPYPGKMSHYNDLMIDRTGVSWSDLEAAERMPVWANLFYSLQKVAAFSPAARILLLSSLPENSHCLRYYHRDGTQNANILLTQMEGLAIIASAFPEFKNREESLKLVVRKMDEQLSAQVYPDGTQNELTSHYHRIAAMTFDDIAKILRHAKHPIHQRYAATVEKMFNYIAYSMCPDGYSPLNNDSDRDHSSKYVLDWANTYKRNDWIWIATNGIKGTRPLGQPSVIFPWAGQMIMRSGWDSDAHWAFFDIGPSGKGPHHHRDKLHLSIAAYGRDILVDAGRYTYRSNEWTTFFRGTFAHNTIIIDGRGQNRDIEWTTKPLMKETYVIEHDYDYARGSFMEGYNDCQGKVIHTRGVVYLRGKFWIVIDRITTDRPRNIQTMWHYHPDCTVVLEDGSATSTDPCKGNLRIIPVSNIIFKANIIKGQIEPNIQGWYSEKYNIKKAAPTVIYSADTDKTATFAWILIPSKGSVPLAKAKILSQDEKRICIGVDVLGEEKVEIAIPITEGNVSINYGVK